MTAIGITHVSTELAPYAVCGGLGIGLRRLIDQLARAGVCSRVLIESRADLVRRDEAWGELVPLPVAGDRYEQLATMNERALEIIARASDYDRAVVAHDNECAATLTLARRHGFVSRDTSLVLWLHSLSDRSADRLPLRERLPPGSLTANAIAAADLCVTSPGVLDDADAFEWPTRMQAMQRELLRAKARGAVLCVSPEQNLDRQLSPDPPSATRDRPQVLFPARANVNKGVAVFIEIAARLSDLDVDFVVTGEPDPTLDMARPGVSRIRWIGWRSQAELFSLIGAAHCVVIPSLSEGFGVGAAEAVQLGARVLHHDIGGLRSLPRGPRCTALSLSTSERATLYEIWASFFERESTTHWQLWDHARPRLSSLLDRWVERVEAALREEPCSSSVIEPPAHGNTSWGHALAQRL
jgi:glycosyltransferase involved in cell wall biosynthesis